MNVRSLTGIAIDLVYFMTNSKIKTEDPANMPIAVLHKATPAFIAEEQNTENVSVITYRFMVPVCASVTFYPGSAKENWPVQLSFYPDKYLFCILDSPYHSD